MRALAAAPGGHRVCRRLPHRRVWQPDWLLLEALHCICQHSHLPHNCHNLHLRGHHRMWRAGLRHGGWRRGLFPTERVPHRSGDPRSLSSSSCHLERTSRVLWGSQSLFLSLLPPLPGAPNLLRPIPSSPDRRKRAPAKEVRTDRRCLR